MVSINWLCTKRLCKIVCIRFLATPKFFDRKTSYLKAPGAAKTWIAKFLLWLWVKPNSWLVFCYCCYKTNMKEKTRPESHRFVEIVEHKKSWYFVWSCTDSFQCFAWKCWWLDLKHTSERSLSKTAHKIMMINISTQKMSMMMAQKFTFQRQKYFCLLFWT